MNVKMWKQAVSLLLVVAIVILLIPSFSLELKAAYADGIYTFEAGDVAVITEDFINTVANGLSASEGEKFRQNPVFQITQGVYSVTVSGDINVTVIFGTESGGTYTGVTIDRSSDGLGNANTGNTTKAALYQAGKTLGWKYYDDSYYVPTAPFWIRDGANVNALFLGDCVLKAGRNRLYMQSQTSNLSALNGDRGGYAGIQVSGDSSLTIMDTGGTLNDPGSLTVYGGWCNTTVDTSAQNNKPNGLSNDNASGGAGIGGGANYDTSRSFTSTYTEGTPGDITILSGNITAYGGHLAAGIGGGHNSAATTGTISILGGNLYVKGGAYAGGIGEGDSAKRSMSGAYKNDYMNS